MRTKSRFIGISSATAVAIAVTVPLYVASDAAFPSTSVGDGATPEKTAPRIELAQAGKTTSGGPSSLNETYKDWLVGCVQQASGKRCALSQNQVQQNGQRVLAIELNAPTGSTLSGVLVLPFGLVLDSGVSLQIDDKPSSQSLRFRTCLPGGCIVPLNFDAPMIAALRSGSVLKVKAVADGGKDTPFAISLQGFPTALDRLAVLSR